MRHLTSLTIIVLIALSLLFGCAYYNILFNAKKNYEEGVKEMKKRADQTKVPAQARNYFEATIDKCWKLIELFSDKSKYADDALFYICKSEYYVERYTQAKLHLEQFIRKYPKSKFIPEANLWYGKVLMRLDEYEKADQSLRTAINTSDDSKIKAEAYFELGSFEFNNGDYETAIDYYQKALNEDPGDQYRALLQFNLGEAFYIQKDFENAIKHFKKVEKYDPSLDIEYRTKLHLADSYSESDKYEDAHKILRRMLTAPRFKEFIPVIKTAIGENYEKQKLYLDAMDIYKETIAEKKNSVGTAQAAYNLAGIFENVYNNIDSAVVYYGMVGKLFGNFDSLQTAKNKEVFLRELKDIRDQIKQDKRLVYKLENDNYFRDSLYTAQFNDSVAKAMGITKVDTQETEQHFSPFQFSAFEDTTQKALADSAQSDTTIANDSIKVASENEIPSFEDRLSFRDLESKKAEKLEINDTKEPQTANKEIPEQKLELRKLPQIKKDLMSNRYHLAEYYLLKVENYDSAAYLYKRFLTLYEDTLLTPKALYSLRFIYSQPGYYDSVKVDSLESLILNDYPESIFSKEILRQKGLVVEKTDEDSLELEAQKLFLEAESLYFAKDINDALQKYERVAELDTSAEWGAKAMYAKAWIYEKELNEKEMALNSYEKIIKDYPGENDYLTAARKKTTMSKEATKIKESGSEEKEAIATVDTVQATEGKVPEEIIAGNGHSVSSQIIERDKIRWRMNRYRK